VSVVAHDQRRAGGSAGSFALGPASAILVDMSASLTCPTFVGRTAESARLAEARDRASAGTPAVVVVGGEAGVGKSRLVGELVASSRAAGATVLTGGCVELGGEGLPFAPIVEALRMLARALDGPGLATAVPEPARTELARLLPELGLPPAGGPAPPWLDLGSAQGRLFELLLGLLERLADHQPTILVVEDLHWADRSTRDLLAFLVRNLRHGRVLLLLTYRSDELHRRHPLRPLLAELERDRRVERLELGRFDRGEVAAQLTGILGAAPAARFVDRIHARSGGNAFFVEELAAAASARGAPAPGGLDGELPPSLRDTLLARIELLPEPTQQVLRVAAAAGGRVAHELLAEVAGLPEPALLAGLREAVSAQVLLVDAHHGTYGFRHALVKEAVYGELLPGERTRLHDRFAVAFQQASAGPPSADPALAAELAWHWYAAHDLERALPAAVEAGLAAERSYAFAEAQRHFERALELWERVPAAPTSLDRVELLGRAAEAAANAGVTERAVSLVRGALAEVDPERDRLRAGLLTQRLAHHLRIAGRPGAFEAYQEAVRLVPPSPPTAERASVLAGLGQALMLRASFAEARAVCEEAIAAARAAGACAVESHALSTLGVAVFWLGDRAAGLADLREARRLAGVAGSAEDEVRACINLSSELDDVGRTEEAVAAAMEGLAVARAAGLQRTVGTFLAANAANSLYQLGRWDEAERLTAPAVELGAAEDVNAVTLLGIRALLEAGRGDFQAALDHVDAARRLVGDLFVAMQYPVALFWIEGEAAVWQGRHAEASKAVADGLGAVRTARDELLANNLLAVGLRVEGDRVELAGPRNDAATVAEARLAAAALLERARAAAVEPAAPAPLAVLATCEAEWTRVRGASDPARWRAAVAAWDEAGHPYRAAYARWRAAAALLARRGDRELALALLREADAVAAALGAAPLRREVQRLARLGRIELAPAAPAGPDAGLGLTARELEVLRLVAEGRSNRQVAEELFISVKTASVHVSNILAKLGVASRVEAAAVAHRTGLVDPPGA
jgi:DNA-binding CsgD family transcriptional regulator